MATESWAVGLVILTATIGSLGPLFLKKGSEGFSLNPLKIIKNKYLMLGIFFYGTTSLLFIAALKGGELSVLYPLIALVYVWVSLLSVKFLGEKMTTLKWTGIALILIGIALIGLGG